MYGTLENLPGMPCIGTGQKFWDLGSLGPEGPGFILQCTQELFLSISWVLDTELSVKYPEHTKPTGFLPFWNSVGEKDCYPINNTTNMEVFVCWHEAKRTKEEPNLGVPGPGQACLKSGISSES